MLHYPCIPHHTTWITHENNATDASETPTGPTSAAVCASTGVCTNSSVIVFYSPFGNPPTSNRRSCTLITIMLYIMTLPGNRPPWPLISFYVHHNRVEIWQTPWRIPTSNVAFAFQGTVDNRVGYRHYIGNREGHFAEFGWCEYPIHLSVQYNLDSVSQLYKIYEVDNKASLVDFQYY